MMLNKIERDPWEVKFYQQQTRLHDAEGLCEELIGVIFRDCKKTWRKFYTPITVKRKCPDCEARSDVEYYSANEVYNAKTQGHRFYCPDHEEPIPF